MDFIIYVGGVLVCCLILFLFSRHAENILKTKGRHHPDYQRISKLHPFCCAALSGFLGAQSVLFAKSTTEIIKSTLALEETYIYAFSYLILGLMLLFIFLQLHWMAVALKYFDAVYVVPVFQVLDDICVC